MRGSHILGRASPHKPPPKGVMQSDGRIKIAVAFDRKTFEGLCKRALEKNLPFSEVVSDCAACGLLDLEDSERHEPLKVVK